MLDKLTENSTSRQPYFKGGLPIDLLDHFIKDNNAEINVVDSMPTLVCDSVKIGEVFLNLITNAIKYNDKDSKKIDIGIVEKEDKYIFSVKDNGIGIDKKNYKKIFKIFNRLHGREKYGGGTGAGMTIVKKIIEKHDGEIWLESTLDEGSTFYFSISKNLKEGSEEDGNNAKRR